MRILTLVIMILATQLAQAAHPFTGVYAGASVGGSLLGLQVDHALTLFTPGVLHSTFPSEDTNEAMGWAGWLAMGYSYQFNNHFVLGVEATAGLANPMITYSHELHVDDAIASSYTEIELKNDFALLFKPGYVVRNNTQIYALVGPRWGNFESDLTTHVITDIATDLVSAYELGFTAGIGMIFLITDNLSFGLEYAYTYYGNMTSPETTSLVTIPGIGITAAVTDDPDFKMSTNSLAAQLAYHF